MDIDMQKIFFNQPPEINEEGNREYKWKLGILDDYRLQRFISQMKFRLYEGNGKALYIIGIYDNGEPIGIKDEEMYVSINQLKRAILMIEGKIESIRYYKGKRGRIATVRIKNIDENKLNIFND
jgi:GTPase